MKHLFLAILLFVFTPFSPIKSQDIGGIINVYTNATQISASPDCGTIITVNSSTGFSIGEYLLVIQMQGATILENNDSSFGTISDIGHVGNFEKKLITNIIGNDIHVAGFLSNTYNTSAIVQVVNIPQYANANVTSQLTAAPWNGSNGGILALEVTGTLTLNADINVSGLGYRGGAVQAYNITCNWFTAVADWFYPLTTGEGGQKGEGIARYLPNKQCGRGAQANGGGGGNDHNSGGGGGSSIAVGGDGGTNSEPGTWNCKGNAPGVAGRSLTLTDKLFLGGGGGSGHGNNSFVGRGGTGGGIAIVYANTIEANTFAIIASGTNGGSPSGDGGGGGGAGGGILVDAATINGNLNIVSIGGNGGNTFNNNSNRCFGPGGGGSGGYLLTNASGGYFSTFQGGIPGVVNNSTNGCIGSSLGADPGGTGAIYPIPVLPPAPYTGPITFIR